MHLINNHWKKILWGIITASFLLSLFHSFYFRIEPSVDAGAYDRIAVNVLNGHGYRQDLYLPPEKDNAIGRVGPGYEFFLVAVYYIFGHHYEAVWVLQAFFHALSVFLVFLIARKVGPSVEGPTLKFKTGSPVGDSVLTGPLLAAAIFGFYPDLIIGSSMLLAENLAIFLMLISVSIFFRILDKPGARFTILLGAIFALSVLVRTPLLLIILPFIYFFYSRKLLLNLVLLLFVFAAVMTPWTIRNYQVYGAFIPTSLTFGDDLLSGNHPGASGELDDSRIQFTAKYNDYDMVSSDRLSAKEAIIFILSNPLEFLKITLFRISMYFSFARPTGWWPYLSGSLWQPAVLLSSAFWAAILFIFGFYGLVEAIKKIKQSYSYSERSEESNILYLLAFLAAVVLPIIFIVVETRYRYPSYAFFAIFAGLGIVEAIYPVRSPAKPIVKKNLEGEADLRLSVSSDGAPSLTSNEVKNANGYAIINAKRLVAVFLILFGNTVFDVLRNFERIAERLPDLLK